MNQSKNTAACGIIVAAPSSGSGKTVFTLGLIRHIKRSGGAVATAKVGPDYIDSAFHTAAAGRNCINLDAWAMRDATISGAVTGLSDGADWIVCEGVMGLFDGAAGGGGSTADLAEKTGWPIILVIDARAQGASVAAIVRGFSYHRKDIEVAGVIFNRVASDRHARILRQACADNMPDVAVLGCLPDDHRIELPSRHLGLVQAEEHGGLSDFLDRAADMVSENVDVKELMALARPSQINKPGKSPAIPIVPLGQRIAVASDIAFAFRYELVIGGWRAAGAEIEFFSPLADQSPAGDADAVYLPGGYPELHCGAIAAAGRFVGGLRDAARRGAVLFGECGGYMVLGRGIVDADGVRHEMASLLGLETSFANPKRHLGYRQVRIVADGPLGSAGAEFCGHEFHYAVHGEKEPFSPLFKCRDAEGTELPPAGMVEGSVMGSFIHLIDAGNGGGNDVA